MPPAPASKTAQNAVLRRSSATKTKEPRSLAGGQTDETGQRSGDMVTMDEQMRVLARVLAYDFITFPLVLDIKTKISQYLSCRLATRKEFFEGFEFHLTL